MKWFKIFSTRKRNRRRGMMTLEWVLLVTVMFIGVVGGLGAVRAAINSELLDLSEAIEMLSWYDAE